MLKETIDYKISEFIKSRDDVQLTTDEDVYSKIKKSLIKNQMIHGDFYCPCQFQKIQDNVCPCKDARLNDNCHCKLFEFDNE